MIGQTISHYKILSELGRGGMGVVYKAEDTKLDRPVALKFLAPHLLRDDEARKRFEREAKAAARLDQPALSPDGTLVAYASDRAGGGDLDVWVEQIDGGGEPIPLTNHPGDDHEPDFSPDGRTIAFRSERDGGGVYTVPALGGDSRLLVQGGRRRRFSPDGQYVAYWKSGVRQTFLGSVGVVRALGGEPRTVQPDFFSALYPIWTPDSRHLLFAGSADLTLTNWDWWVVPLEGGEPVRTNVAEALITHGVGVAELFSTRPGAWTPGSDAVLLEADEGDTRHIWRVPLSTETWQPAGPPLRLTAGRGEGQPAVGSGGVIAFADRNLNIDIWALPVNPNDGQVLGELERLTFTAASELSPSISLDGSTMVYALARTPISGDIWIKDLNADKPRALTVSPWLEIQPVISADGSRVAYSVIEDTARWMGQETTWIESLQTAGKASERLCTRDCFWAWGLNSTGDYLIYMADQESQILGVLATASKEQIGALKHPDYPLYQAGFSPDDQWIVFHGTPDAERTQVFIAPVPQGIDEDAEQWIRVTDGSALDDKPRWSPDGNLIYLLSNRDGFICLWAQRLNPATKEPVDKPFLVHHFHNTGRSLAEIPVSQTNISVARDKIVMPLAELSGNIWLMEPQERAED